MQIKENKSIGCKIKQLMMMKCYWFMTAMTRLWSSMQRSTSCFTAEISLGSPSDVPELTLNSEMG